MDNDLSSRLDVLEAKIDATYRSAEKMRKYFLITVWATIITIVLPLIAMAVILPYLLNTLTGSLGL